MAQIIPIGYGQIVHVMSLTGDAEPIVVTYGLRLTGTFTLQAEVDDLHDAWGDFMGAVIPNVYKLIRTEIRFSVTSPDAQELAIATGDRVGGGSATPLPQNCAYLVHKRTSTPGRRGRGRLYIPGVPEGNVDVKGLIDSAQVTGMQTNCNTLLTRLNEGGDVANEKSRQMVLLHSAPVDGSNPPAPSDVTALQVDSVIATQRRRLR